jgi:clan AA aspartic protease (TIGR02281 family)
LIKIILILCAVCVALIGLATSFRVNLHDWFPDDQAAHEHLRTANALAHEDNEAAAILEYEQAARLSPKNASIRLQYAKALEKAGQQSEALVEMLQAVKLSPGDKKVQYKYAEFLDSSGDTEAALQQYENLLRSPPTNQELLKDTLFFAAKDYEQLGRYKRAEELYNAYLKVDKTLNSAWLGLSRCQQKSNRSKDAIATLRTGIRFIPRNAVLHHDLGEMLADDNQKDAAIRELRKTVELEPDSADDVSELIARISSGKNNSLVFVPLERTGNSYVARATLNDSAEATLVVDSGADICMISHDLAKRLKLNLTRARPTLVSSVTGTESMGKVIVDTIRVGGATEHEVKVVVHDLPGGEDGLLGMSFLNRYTFSIDPHKNLLQLSKRLYVP